MLKSWMILAFLAFMEVRAYSNGPPGIPPVCKSMMPSKSKTRGHGKYGLRNAEECKLVIDVEPNDSVNPEFPGKFKISVSLEEGTQFKGFMAQVVRPNQKNPIGKFMPNLSKGQKGVNCRGRNNGISHSEASLKDEVVLDYVAPRDLLKPDLENGVSRVTEVCARVTVVVSKDDVCHDRTCFTIESPPPPPPPPELEDEEGSGSGDGDGDDNKNKEKKKEDKDGDEKIENDE